MNWLLIIPVFLFFFMGGIVYFAYVMEINHATIFISDNQDGEDCLKIGNWDPQSKTCALNRDLVKIRSIQINSNGITIDGNNYSMIGYGGVTKEVGIKILSKSGVTIKNLQLKNFMDGVLIENSFNTTLTNLNISQNVRHGISIMDSDNNLLVGNIIKQVKDGIRIGNSNNTVITKNTLANNRVEGIDIHRSFDVMVYHNNLLEHDAIPVLDSHPENLNIFFISSGGNYYSVYDEESEGCYDQNSDGFCDSPFVFGYDLRDTEEECVEEFALQNTVNYNDPLPFTEKDGWNNLN